MTGLWLVFRWFLIGSWLVFDRITTSQANASLVLHCQFTRLPGDVDETSIYSFCPAEQWTSVSNRIHVSKRGESCTEAHRARARGRGRWRKRGDLSLSLHLSLSISPSGDRLMDASIGILLEQLREWRWWCGWKIRPTQHGSVCAGPHRPGPHALAFLIPAWC